MTYPLTSVGDFTIGDRVTVSTSDRDVRLAGVITGFFSLGYSGYFAAAVKLDVGGEARDYTFNLVKE